MGNTFKQNINTDDNEIILFNYNNGLDKVTEKDIYSVLEVSAYNRGYNGLQDLKDLEKCSSTNFNLLLQDIGKYFKSTKALIKSYSNDPRGIMWEYDISKLLALTDVYINICYEYDKRVSITGFLYMCGIGNGSYMYYKEKQPLELSENTRKKIAEKLSACDNDAQKNKARDSKNPILNIAYNNYEHGWNGQIKRNEINGVIKSLDDIKNDRLKLSATDTQNDF